MTGSADDGGENGTRRIVAGETGFAHAGAVVNNQSCNLIVTHVDAVGEGGRGRITQEKQSRDRTAGGLY